LGQQQPFPPQQPY
nr:Chain A, LEU-GLY-GLN-GLN-GLN-PRO-PHE-PRO-PRO-GLN-GLN-PRO-TYR [Homo sapiens]